MKTLLIDCSLNIQSILIKFAIETFAYKCLSLRTYLRFHVCSILSTGLQNDNNITKNDNTCYPRKSDSYAKLGHVSVCFIHNYNYQLLFFINLIIINDIGIYVSLQGEIWFPGQVS